MKGQINANLGAVWIFFFRSYENAAALWVAVYTEPHTGDFKHPCPCSSSSPPCFKDILNLKTRVASSVEV